MKKFFYLFLFVSVMSTWGFLACDDSNTFISDAYEYEQSEDDIKMINELKEINAEFIGIQTRSHMTNPDIPNPTEPTYRRPKWKIALADALGGLVGGMLSGLKGAIVGAVFTSGAVGFNNGIPHVMAQNEALAFINASTQAAIMVHGNPTITPDTSAIIQIIPAEYQLEASQLAFVHNAALEIMRTGDLNSMTNIPIEYQNIIADTAFVNSCTNIVNLIDDVENFTTLAGNGIESTVFNVLAQVFPYVQSQDDANAIITRYLLVIKANRTLSAQTKGYLYKALTVAAYSFRYWDSVLDAEE